MNSLISKNISNLESQIIREFDDIPLTGDPFDDSVNLGYMPRDEFNLELYAIIKGYNREPFFYGSSDFDQEGFSVSETQDVLQRKGFTLEEIKYFLERVLEIIRSEKNPPSTLSDEELKELPL